MYIEPLSIATLDEVTHLRDKIFPGLSELDRETLQASLLKDKYQKWYSTCEITQLDYWVGIDEQSKQVVGLTGLYCEIEDEDEAYWLGWFCVASEFRGQGLGNKLLDFTINKAKASDKLFLRLYTLNVPNFAAARTLYEKRGFRKIYPEAKKRSYAGIMYYELELLKEK